MGIFRQVVKRIRKEIDKSFPFEKIEEKKIFLDRFWRGEEVERPPILLATYPKKDIFKIDIPDSLGECERKLINEMLSFLNREVGIDDWVPTHFSCMSTQSVANAFGCKFKQGEGKKWVEPIIHSPSEIDHLRKPDLDSGEIGKIIEYTKLYRDYADHRIPLGTFDIQNPLTVAIQMMGMSHFFSACYDYPSRVHKLLSIITDYMIEVIFFQKKCADNFNPSTFPAVWCPKDLGIGLVEDNLLNLSPEMVEQFSVTYNNKLSEAFNGLFIHSCSIKKSHFEVLLKNKNLRILNWDFSISDPYEDILDFFKDKLVLAPTMCINSGRKFSSQSEFIKYILEHKKRYTRLFCVALAYVHLSEDDMDRKYLDPQKVMEVYYEYQKN